MTTFKDVEHLYAYNCKILWTGSLGDGNTSLFGGDIAVFLRYDPNAKPILRPIWDINEYEEEYIQDVFGHGYGQTPSYLTQSLREGTGFMVPSIVKVAKLTAYLLKQGFDLYGLIESGQAISKCEYEKEM